MKNKILVLLLVFLSINTAMYSQKVLPLYKDSIPNSKPGPDEEVSKVSDGMLIISKISRPTLTLYMPEKEKANGTAVVICPGGGYMFAAAGHEGADVAEKFVAMGVTAIVLKYRIPNDATMINKEIGPLQDAQQAIKTVRDSAAKWNINPARIGIMGFSAGGHLASTAGTHFDKTYIPNETNTSLRPDFMMLIYPVISFQPGIRHNGSMENLIGKKPAEEKITAYSNELQVTATTPPTFLVHASDDDAVNPMNSVLFYNALLSKKVPAELHIYQSGGHGFGLMMKNNGEVWMERCRNWMQFNGWLGSK